MIDVHGKRRRREAQKEAEEKKSKLNGVLSTLKTEVTTQMFDWINEQDWLSDYKPETAEEVVKIMHEAVDAGFSLGKGSR